MRARRSPPGALWKALGASALVNAALLLGLAYGLRHPAAPRDHPLLLPRPDALFVTLAPPPPPVARPHLVVRSHLRQPPAVRPLPTRPQAPPPNRPLASMARPAPPKTRAVSLPRPASVPVPALSPPGLSSAAPAFPPETVPSTPQPDSQSAGNEANGQIRAVAIPAALPGRESAPSDDGKTAAMAPAASGPPIPPPQRGPTQNARIVAKSQPPYPPSAREDGVEGTVTLRVSLDAEGTVQRVDVQNSSGDPRLDDAARQEVSSRWRFAPRLENGMSVAATTNVYIVFTLTED